MKSPLRFLAICLSGLSLALLLACNQTSSEAVSDKKGTEEYQKQSDQMLQEEMPYPEIRIQILNHQYVFKLL